MNPRAWASTVWILATRNLWAAKWRTLFTGGVMGAGALLTVVGSALLDSIESAMAQTIIASVAGHIQVYDEDAPDPLALFGSTLMGAEDVGRIPDFSRVRQALEQLDGVEAVIPMSQDFATAFSGGEVDRVLQLLRESVDRAEQAQITAGLEKLRQLVALMIPEQERQADIRTTADSQSAITDLERVLEPAFERWLTSNPGDCLHWLDTTIAPLGGDGRSLYVRYLATDMERFPAHFDRFHLLAGEMLPPGKRGILLHERFYERRLKNRVAVVMDSVQRKRVENNATFGKDAELAALVRGLDRQYSRVILDLDLNRREEVTAKLKAGLASTEDDLAALVQELLRLDDANFEAHHQLFYEVVAPAMRLYLYQPGDDLVLRGITRSGYQKSVPVRIYGIFRFNGLERSDLAGANNLIDLMTFRDLYGLMTAERRKEIEGLRAGLGVKAIPRDQAEDALFGDPVLSSSSAEPAGTPEPAASPAPNPADSVDKGVVLSAAVVLKPGVDLRAAQQRIVDLSRKRDLGLQAVDWQAASGMVGQFVIVIRLVLYVAVGIILLVALVIINNSMVMAATARTQEIGTLRAIGAQRSLILALFLNETLILGMVAGGLGCAVGAGLIHWLHGVGLPATTDILFFLFSGPRLFPSVETHHIASALVLVGIASVASTLYPALLATRVQPVVAMEGAPTR